MKKFLKLKSMRFRIIIVAFLFVSTCFNQLLSQPAIEWSKCYGGPQWDMLFDLKSTIDGGVVVAGYSEHSGGDVTINFGVGDCWILKLDAAGVIQWQKSFGGTDQDEAYSIIQTSDSGYAFTGTTNSNDVHVTGLHGSNDLWFVKLDINGNLSWQRCLGGGNYDEGWSILETDDKGFIIAGNSSSYNGDVVGLHGGDDYWIVKLDSSGTIQWSKCFGGTMLDQSSCIVKDGNGGYTILGRTSSNNGDVAGIHPGGTINYPAFDFWLINIDSIGNLQWQKCIGGSRDEYGASLERTIDNGYILAGTANSTDGDVTNIHPGTSFGIQTMDMWVVKTDASGNIEWEKCFGGSSADFASKVVQTPDHGFIISGYTSSTDGDVTNFRGLIDSWIIKVDSVGNLLWQKCIGGSFFDYPTYIDISNTGKVYFGMATRSNDYDVHGNHAFQANNLKIDYFVGAFSDIIASSIVTPICTSCNGSITVSTGLNNPPYTYLWSNGQTTANAISLCQGNYTVTITNSMGVSIEGSYLLIADTLNVDLVQNPASCWNCPDGSATLQLSGGSGINSVYWIGYPDTTLTLSGLPHGWVTGCATDAQGCVACDSIEVLSPVGIFEYESLNDPLHVYPNPTDGIISISLSDGKSKLSRIEIYNSLGELITISLVENNTTLIDMKPYSQGIYFIRGFDGYQRNYTKAFQVLK